MSGDPEARYTLPEAFLACRRIRLEKLLSTHLAPPPSSGLEASVREHLLEQARQLYWEELSWERLTDEEGLRRRGLVELAFPGFLAFVDGLLLREAAPDSRAPAHPRPEVAEDILLFLAGRAIALTGETARERAAERDAALRLIDLVLYRLHRLDVEEADRLALVWAEDEDEDEAP